MKLCEIHGKAVDFPKTGYCPEVDPKLLTSIYPDFMEKVGFVIFLIIFFSNHIQASQS